MAKFRTKARAVELLGKGQIADLPTAISELWKNGYDAYADNLNCSLYLPGYKDNKQPIFTLSDDGVGMSNEDLLNKWIILGTDSKARGKIPLTSEQRLGKEPRIPMGEKGIGRLSVAYLGPQMLMLTKKKNENCQLLFLDWRILDNYNLFIDDLDIPIEEFSSISEFKEEFDVALSIFRKNLNNELWNEQSELQSEIDFDINKIELPTFLLDEIVEPFTHVEKNGTYFIVFKPHEQLLELSDFIENTQSEKDTIIEIRKSLSGLYNEYIGNRKFETSFNIYNNIGRYNLLDDFFSPEDFKIADHYIKGSFNEFGSFNGEVRVFNEIVKHGFKPSRLPGKTPYGKFTIELGVLEGDQKSSRLTEEQYRIIKKKINLFGGLYLYRDDFRVLPYGRTEYDFLTFEERRSSSAGYYFFSQRNMLGYLAISRDANSNLKDKAGREGLIANQAYREFKYDLIQFFKDLSLTYFKSGSKDDPDSNLRTSQLEEIRKKKERLIEAEKKKAKLTRKKFVDDLKMYGPQIENLTTEIEQLYSQLSGESNKVEILYNEFENLTEILEDKKNKLRELKIQKPYRAEITSSQEKNYQDYQSKYTSLALKAESCETIITETRKRFDVQNLKDAFMKRYNFNFKEIYSRINLYKNRFSNSSNQILKAFDDEKTIIAEDFKSQLNQIPIEKLKSKKELEEGLLNIERLTDEFKNTINEKFESFIKHVESLNFDIDDDYLVGWYKEQNENIEKKLQETNELAQLGMSIEIIDHQFNVMYAHISDSLSYFKNYVSNHIDLNYQFEQLNSAFQHLENNHRLLFPLYKTSRRSRTIIKGENIKEYLLKFFEAIFAKNSIELTSDESFDKYEFFTFESIIKPVFINVVNNAVYWLTSAKERKIHLSTKGKRVLILNNGEKIEDKILEDIFTLFYSKRRDGRGIGLYLARTNLKSIGYNIIASNSKEYNLLKGACFIIEPIEM
jgi:hypothetical protein